MSTVDNSNILGTKTGPELVSEIATQFGNTDTELDLRPEAALAETISGNWTLTGETVFGPSVPPFAVAEVVIDGSGKAFNMGLTRIQDTTGGANLRLRKSRGSVAAPAKTLSGDSLMNINSAGHNGSDWTEAAASIRVFTLEDFDLGLGCYMSLRTGTIGSALADVERLKLDENNATFSVDIVVSGTVDGRDVATDGTKLDGIAAAAKANLSDLLDVDLTGRGDTDILEWDVTTSKYLHATKPTGGGSTNLSQSLTAITVKISSDTGTDVTIASANGTNAGVLTSADKSALDSLAATAIKDADFTVTGICVRSAAGNYVNRTIAGGNEITVTNGSGASGNPTVELSRNITVSTGSPSGGSDGDLWFQV